MYTYYKHVCQKKSLDPRGHYNSVLNTYNLVCASCSSFPHFFSLVMLSNMSHKRLKEKKEEEKDKRKLCSVLQLEKWVSYVTRPWRSSFLAALHTAVDSSDWGHWGLCDGQVRTCCSKRRDGCAIHPFRWLWHRINASSNGNEGRLRQSLQKFSLSTFLELAKRSFLISILSCRILAKLKPLQKTFLHHNLLHQG